MTRGNWERRIELSESRRLEAKQRKQRNGERKIFKKQALDLMKFLDRNSKLIFFRSPRKAAILHIWIDKAPSSYDYHMNEVWEDEKNQIKKKTKNKNKNHSACNAKHQGNKKSHPRSKENAIASKDLEKGSETPHLCRSHFFFDKCHNKKKCCYSHLCPKTLTEVILDASSSEASFPLEESEGGMDMVYYISLSINELFERNQDDNRFSSSSISSVSDLIIEAMSKQELSTTNIVYFVFGEQLVYDRYRDGVIIERSELVVQERLKNIGKNHKPDMIPLSAAVLEYILTFLDDTAVASMASVCRTWHHEIGKQSGNLWRHLLQRRSWPTPTLTQYDDESDELFKFRGAFLSHYTAVRDVKFIKAGVSSLLGRKSTKALVGCYRSFESLKNFPRATNYCVSVEIWSDNCFLAGYATDCSLRLFDSVNRSGNSGERLCRELICYRIDPYKMTKKREFLFLFFVLFFYDIFIKFSICITYCVIVFVFCIGTCRLVAMAIDDTFIGCLLHVIDDITEGEAFVLSVLSRETFLIDDNSNNDTAHVIDIGQSVIDFLLNCDDFDQGLLQLRDFISNDGDLDDIEILVSKSLVECGNGRFMIEVSVIIPSAVESTDEEDSITSSTTLLFQKLFLFCCSTRSIIWMSDSYSSLSDRLVHEESTLASLKIEEGGRYGSKVVSLSSSSSEIMSLSINPDCNYNSSTLVQGTDSVRNLLLVDRWSLRQEHKRPVIILDNQIIVADNLVWDDNGPKVKKSVLSFYLISDGNENLPTFNTLDLAGNIEVLTLNSIRTTHVMAICRLHVSTSDGADTDITNVAGQWFGPEPIEKVFLYAIVIDVESRSEIFRTCLMDSSEYGGYEKLPIQVAIAEDTVAIGLWWNGVILTGANAMKSALKSESLEFEPSPSKSCKKIKKSKKKTKKMCRKKDGYARGMSQRG